MTEEPLADDAEPAASAPPARPLALLNRERAILEFSRRVLAQARRADVPLLERLRYVTIVSSNLDEFFEVRLADYIERYFARFAGVRRYMDETRVLAHEKGYVETVFGRRLWLPEINSGNGPRRAGAERQAINAPMQGTAADLIKLAMIAVQDELDRERRATRMIMQVHDELVLEVPEAELDWAKEAVPLLMAGVAALKVPLLAEVGVGRNWDEAH